MNQDLKEYLIRMHQVINLPDYNNAMIVAQHILEAIEKFEITIFEFESALREVKSRVHLLGLPLRVFNQGYRSWLPPNANKDYPYALWICMNGFDEISKTLEDFKIEETDIDKNLSKTGFLIVDAI